jgi:hypothetical protein
MSGELRRPPQLWEQRLARTTAVIAAGVAGGDATAIVVPQPPPGAGGGTEPAPVSPAPGLFTAPSTPTLLKQVQGINVLWDGLNSAGDLWPYDTSWVEIHMDTTSGFTPGTATLKGRLARPGAYTVGGLSSGVTYYFKLRGADPAGNYTAASTQASSTTGSASSGDIITIEGDQIIGGTITGQYIAGGTITGSYLSGGTISGGYITGGTVNGGFVSGGTVEGSVIQTGSSGSRIIFKEVVSSTDSISFYNSSNTRVMYMQPGTDRLALFGNIGNTGGTITTSTVDASVVEVGSSTNGRGLRVEADGEVFSYGVDDNTTASAANVRVGTNAQLLKSTSTVRVKDQLSPLDDNLAGVPADKLSAEPASVDPYDVLELTPTEFRSLSPADGDSRALGFIAEDVAAKFPWAANWDEDGLPSAVEDRPIIAALVAVIQDLRARIEALEA